MRKKHDEDPRVDHSQYREHLRTAATNEAIRADDDGYPWDDDEPEDESERCTECGAWPEEYHEMDCSIGDDEEDEDAADCDSVCHPGCRNCEVKR